MNIFFFHTLAKPCAQAHPDQLVVKMILEYLQILYSVFYLRHEGEWLETWRTTREKLGAEATVSSKDGEVARPYGLTHEKHCCVLWACASYDNARWLLELALCLCEEFTYRNTKAGHPPKHHKCEPHLAVLAAMLSSPELVCKMWPSAPQTDLSSVRDVNISPPMLAMPDCIRASHGTFRISAQHVFTGTPVPSEPVQEQVVCPARDCESAVVAYRNYLVCAKGYAKWDKRRPAPAWYTPGALWESAKIEHEEAVKKEKDRFVRKMLKASVKVGRGKTARVVPYKQARELALRASRCTTVLEIQKVAEAPLACV